MKRLFRFLTVACLISTLLLALAACRGENPSGAGSGGPSVSAAPSGETAGASVDEALRFSATDLGGAAVTESVFSDHKLTMVNVWGTYCGPCIREMPELGRLSEDLAPEGFQIIGIISDSVGGGFTPINPILETARSIIMQTNANYRHLILSESLYNRFMQGVSVVPTTYFVDSEGRTIGDPYPGSRSYEQWKAVIDGLLSGMQ